jgi:protein-L-isoaspartate(D-aspartate) O-methyltransferase
MGIDLIEARQRMVVEQLERRGITDVRVLTAMGNVPRHRFIPAELADQAYEDRPLPIGSGQTISQPYIVALMSEVAALTGRDRVLEVGTGSGYQTAILAWLARAVFSIENVPQLHERARQTLADLGITNVNLCLGDGSIGWPEMAMFDAIIVTAASPLIPRPLLEQLTPDGRLIVPVGEQELQTLVRISRLDGRWREEYFGECRFVRLIGKQGFSE